MAEPGGEVLLMPYPQHVWAPGNLVQPTCRFWGAGL